MSASYQVSHKRISRHSTPCARHDTPFASPIALLPHKSFHPVSPESTASHCSVIRKFRRTSDIGNYPESKL
jgi:hypothetical protein